MEDCLEENKILCVVIELVVYLLRMLGLIVLLFSSFTFSRSRRKSYVETFF